MKLLSTGYQGEQFPFLLETDSNILEMFKPKNVDLKYKLSVFSSLFTIILLDKFLPLPWRQTFNCFEAYSTDSR